MSVPPLPDWESFYVITGSSGAALTGLMFVAIALVADTGRADEGEQGMAAFGTPTVMHLCAVLLTAAILSAPWHQLEGAAIAVAAVGAAGVLYMIIVTRRTLQVTIYRPVLEDWIWHTILPSLAYLAILTGGILMPGWPDRSLFAIGGASVLLLFIGIHNAWDTVTYLAIQAARRRSGEAAQKP